MRIRASTCVCLCVCPCALTHAGFQSGLISVSARQWFEGPFNVVQGISGVSASACVAGTSHCENSGGTGPPCNDTISGIAGASGFFTDLGLPGVEPGPGDCCRFKFTPPGSAHAFIIPAPNMVTGNSYSVSGNVQHSFCVFGMQQPSQSYRYSAGVVNGKATYSFPSPPIGLPVTVRTVITANVSLAAEDDCGDPPAFGGFVFDGLVCVISCSTPDPRWLAVSMSSNSVTSHGFDVNLTNAAPGGYTLTANLSGLTGTSGTFETGVAISVGRGTGFDVGGDTVFDCQDIADIQSFIKSGIPVLTPDEVERLNIVCSGSETDMIDCDDLFALTQIALNLFDSCDLGDADADGQYDWCDMAQLTQAITAMDAALCGANYNILVDMNLDKVLNAADQALLRPLLPTARLLGDANADGLVNFSDIAAVLANFGASGAPWIIGDANGNGTVNFADITAISSNFNASACDP